MKEVVGYGHYGDGASIVHPTNDHGTDQVIGNLHLNVIAQLYSDEIQNALEPFIYELVGTYSLLIFS